MAFRVDLTSRAERDLEGICEFIKAVESTAAAQWFTGLEDAIESLANLPERGRQTTYDPALRFLHYGNKPHVYRILYRIDFRLRRIAIVHIRHGARKTLKRS